MDKKLKELKEEYKNVQIPKELDEVVNQAIKTKARRKKNSGWKWVAGIAAAAIIFTSGVNISPAFAKALSEVPVVKEVVKVITFREYKIDEEKFQANIKVPAISDLGDKTLEDSLNKKYLEENKKLFEDFQFEMKEIEKMGGGHSGVDSGYEVITDNERIFSISRYIVHIAGSGTVTMQFDTIDKINKVLITLPSLFKNEQYINVISDNIQEQMREQMKSDPNKIYWVSGGNEEFGSVFETIAKEQNFYINPDHKLVISFDEYEVAPGYMGVVEFTIPTEVLSELLVSKEYIK